MEHSGEALLAVLADGRIQPLNRACRDLLALSGDEPVGPPFPFRFRHEAEGPDLPPSRPPWTPALDGEPVEATYCLSTGVGNPRQIRIRATPAREGGERVGAVATLLDITEHLQVQTALRRQRDIYAALSQTNQFLVLHDPDPADMFREVCRIAVEYGDFVVSWIGTPDEDGWVRSVAVDGPDSEYLNRIAISTDPERPEGQGPTGRALRERQPVIQEDILNEPRMAPWHDVAARAGVQSTGSFPLWHNGEVTGALTVYAADPFFFTADLVHLLEELALDVSFALDQHQRKAERRRLVEIIEATPDFVGVVDPQGRVQYHNPAAHRLLGWGRGEGAIPHCHPQWAWNLIREEGLPTAEREGIWQGESAFLAKGGTEVPMSQVIVAHREPGGEVTHFSTIARDIRDQKAAESEIRRLAYRDPVTGLPNRSALLERLDQELSRARRHGHCGAVLFLDLDDFKAINDSLGHPVGDALLMELGRRLRGILRQEDVVTRAGGDELVALLPALGETAGAASLAAEQAAEKLQAALADPFDLEGHSLHITASIGIALFPDGEADRDDLLQAADTAMYAAKREGRANLRFYHPEMLTAVRERLALEQDLRRGLDRGELSLFFQPLVDLSTGAIRGAEALVRWDNTERGPVPPGEFIPVAEQNDLILQLGDWVLDEALGHIRRWLDAGIEPLDLGVAVNLSPRQFAQPDFGEHLAAKVAQHGVPTRYLKLEITESLLIQNLATAVDKMQMLRGEGITFAVDDFGTGHSSLAYLQRLPLETLKIDASFVQGLDQAESSSTIIETILAMARHLGMETVAEGVETPAQAAFLRERGCEVAQGFHFARPMPAETFRHWMRRGA